MKSQNCISTNEYEATHTVDSVQINGKQRQVLIWIAFGYGFFALSLPIIIVALSSSNYNTLFHISQQLSTLSSFISSGCPTRLPPIANTSSSTSSPTEFFSSTAIDTSNQSTTSTQSATNTPAISTTISFASSPAPSSTFQTTQTTELPDETESSTPSTQADQPSSTSIPTTKLPQRPGFTVLQSINDQGLISNVNISCWETCNSPKILQPILTFTMTSNKKTYQIQTFILGNEKNEANSYVSYLAIANLFPSYKDQVKVNPDWNKLLKACPEPKKSSCK